MAVEQKNSKYLLYLLIVLIAAGGFVFWQTNLSADPPLYFSGSGQSLSTDPYLYSHHARNRIIFGEWDPFDNPWWIIFEKSLVSYSSYLWFLLAEPSQQESNRVGVILCFGALLFFALGLARHHRTWVVAAFVFCYVVNITLLVYGRLPYLETGLIFLSSVLFFVYTRWGTRPVGLILSGVALALAITMGKLYSALLVPVLLLAVLLSRRQVRWRHAAVVTAAAAVSGLVLIFLLYHGHLEQAFGFFGERTYPQYGFPEGLKSPWAFVEHLIAFGYVNCLYYVSPELLLMVAIGGLLLACYLGAAGKSFADLPPTIVLSSLWIPLVTVGLMPHNYSPHRYTLFLIPLILVFGLSMLDVFGREKKPPVIRLNLKLTTLATVCFWLLFFHLAMIFLHRDIPELSGPMGIWIMLPPAALAAYLFRQLVHGRKIVLNRKTMRAAAVVLVALTGVYNVWIIGYTQYGVRNYDIAEANQDLARILAGDAVVAGPYAATLTSDNNLKSMIHFFVSSSDLLAQYPVTHLAVDRASWEKAAEQYPALQESKSLARYWIRDFEVLIFDVSEISDNPAARAYVPSPLERATAYFYENNDDSALVQLSRIKDVRKSKTAGLLHMLIMQRNNNSKEAMATFLSLAETFPTDFFLQYQCALYMKSVAEYSNNPTLSRRAETYFQRANHANPFRIKKEGGRWGLGK